MWNVIYYISLKLIDKFVKTQQITLSNKTLYAPYNISMYVLKEDI